eukprot:1178900-Prorocentrum_minimum.AAC.2
MECGHNSACAINSATAARTSALRSSPSWADSLSSSSAHTCAPKTPTRTTFSKADCCVKPFIDIQPPKYRP